jgi:hypothetical protein
VKNDTNPLKTIPKNLMVKPNPEKPESKKDLDVHLVKVKNIFGRNIHTSKGKIIANEEGLMPMHEAEHDKRIVIIE